MSSVDPTYFSLLFPPSSSQDKRKRHWSRYEAKASSTLSESLWVRLRPQLPLTQTLTPAPFHTGAVRSVWWLGAHAPSEHESMWNRPLSAAASLVLSWNIQADSERKKIQKTHTCPLSFSEIVKWKVCYNLLKITRWENLQSVGTREGKRNSQGNRVFNRKGKVHIAEGSEPTESALSWQEASKLNARNVHSGIQPWFLMAQILQK